MVGSIMNAYLVNIRTIKTNKKVVVDMGMYGNNMQEVAKKLRKKYPLKSYLISIKKL